MCCEENECDRPQRQRCEMECQSASFRVMLARMNERHVRTFVRRTQKEEERSMAERLEQHNVCVWKKILDSAEGGAGLLHTITKPRWGEEECKLSKRSLRTDSP